MRETNGHKHERTLQPKRSCVVVEQVLPGKWGWLDAKPAAEEAAPQQRVRLSCWLEQVDAARELYRQGQRETLWVLYDYWRIIAEDVQEQARFASETYVSSTFPTALLNTQAGSSSRTATSSPSLLPES